jgi:hypothetical protein
VSDTDSIGAWWEGIELSSPAPGVIQHTHAASVCAGTPCAIHNPSNHHMRDWPLKHRTDKPHRVGGRVLIVSERVCEHGWGHPDPDSLAYLRTVDGAGTGFWGFHGCDGCCRNGGQTPPAQALPSAA